MLALSEEQEPPENLCFWGVSAECNLALFTKRKLPFERYYIQMGGLSREREKQYEKPAQKSC
jgi:hypothetical protein